MFPSSRRGERRVAVARLDVVFISTLRAGGLMGDGREFLEAKAAEDDIEFFFAMFVDMHGKPCAKLVPASAMDVLMEGAGFAGFAAGPMWQTPADPDMIAVPDPASYAKVPWREGLAVVMCDIAVDGKPWPYTPRVVLKRQLARMAEQGLSLKVGVEVEYFLVRRKPGGGIEPADVLDTADFPCYDAKGLYRMYDHLTTVSRYMNQLGFGNYANDHEDANGQFEQNFDYDDALVTADRAIFFRYMVHMLAHEAGMAASFMAKPFAHLTGNGMHTNVSVWEGDRALFGANGEDPRGMGLSPVAYQFIGGLMDHADRVCCGHVPDGQLLQAHRGRPTQLGSDVGAGVRRLRGQQPVSDVPRPRRPPRRMPGGRRLGQPVSRLYRAGRGGDGRRRPQARSGRSQHREPLRPRSSRRGQAGHHLDAADAAARRRQPVA